MRDSWAQNRELLRHRQEGNLYLFNNISLYQTEYAFSVCTNIEASYLKSLEKADIWGISENELSEN